MEQRISNVNALALAPEKRLRITNKNGEAGKNPKSEKNKAKGEIIFY
jgi:hypothetical protein